VNLDRRHLEQAGWTKTAISRFLPPPTITRHTYGRHNYITHTWEVTTVLAVLQQEECRKFFARLRARREREPALPQTIDVLTATQEASRAAHRWRDAASAQYEAGNHGLASTSSANKRSFYRLKDQGIVHLHRTGVLRYIGASPKACPSTNTAMAGCLASIPACIGWERSVRWFLIIRRSSGCQRRRERSGSLMLNIRSGVCQPRAMGMRGQQPRNSIGRNAPVSGAVSRDTSHASAPMRDHEDLSDDFGAA
jgi:hypothetical protein